MSSQRGRPKSEKGKAAVRENGKLGGNPKKASDATRRRQDLARAMIRNLTPQAAKRLKRILESEESTNMDVISAAREVFNRGGLPPQTDIGLKDGDGKTWTPLTVVIVDKSKPET